MGEQLEAILSAHAKKREELIPILQEVQSAYSYLPMEALRKIARHTRLPESRVYGVATFYAQFRFSPMGRKHTMVCRGTACHVSGAQVILDEVESQLGIKEGETTADLEHSLETVACIGACSLAPCLMINNQVEANMTIDKVRSLYKKTEEGK